MLNNGNKRVCIISDHLVTSRLISALITSEGFDTHQISFLIDEINNVKSIKPFPDVVVYDVQEHQVMDSGLCKFIQKHLISKNIPRIIVSSFNIDCTECFERQEGKCAYFLKPWDRGNFLNKVAELAN